MADLAVGISKTVVEALVTRVETAIKEEAELWQIVQRDAAFMRDEFEMMQSFLKTADWARIKNSVVRTWVRQVRDLSYDAEDCVESILLLDTKRSPCTLALWRCLLASCFCYSGTPSPLDLAVAEIKLLKTRVEEVSNRNRRYSLINDDSGSKLIAPLHLSSVSAVSTMAVDVLKEAWCNAKKLQDSSSNFNLITLLTKTNEALRVISVWGTGSDLGTSSFIKQAYDDSKICEMFTSRAWLRLEHPFNPHEFIRTLVHQFHGNSAKEPLSGVDVLTEMMEGQGEDVVKKFALLLRKHKYLVVLEDLSNIAEWHAIRILLPDCKNGSRIVVSTQQLEIAKLCTAPYQVLPLRDLPDAHSIYSFFNKGYIKLAEEIVVDGGYKGLLSVSNNVHLLGRSSDEDKLSKLIYSAAQSDRDYVVSVWGFPGVGKSALVKTVLKDQARKTSPLFEWYGWVDVSHPFDLAEVCRKLLRMQGYYAVREDHKSKSDDAIIQEYRRNLIDLRSLFVIDGLKVKEEWDTIKKNLNLEHSKSCIVVITKDENVAKHCSAGNDGLVHGVKTLGYTAALNLFKQAFQDNKASCGAHIVKEVEDLLPRCGGIPQVIVALAKYLAPSEDNIRQRRLRGLKANFMHELETNAHFVCLGDLFELIHSTCDAIPQSVRACILYLSAFSQAIISIRRNRFVLRWIAEGYSNCTDSKTAEDYAGELFDSLATWKTHVTDWQVNNLFHEYINSRLMEDSKVFFPLVVSVLSEENCSLTPERLGQHLSIRSNWKRDESVFDNLDFSQLQSLTVFGEWKKFFIPYKMRSLRVLDLEGTEGVTDDELQRILVLLPRLRFLSLRGHSEITSLPKSLYDLGLLQTLDIRNTSVTTLPSKVTKLRKLKYIRAGRAIPWIGNDTELAKPPRCSPLSSVFWLPKLRTGDASRGAIEVPRKIGQLTALHTLGAIRVNTPTGTTILTELKKLITRLRKLELYGISRKHNKQLISVFNSGTHLEDLTLCLEEDNDVIPWDDIRCLCNLWSLKLYGGHVRQLPPEILYLHNLKKLAFQIVLLTEADIRCLGRLTELHTLRLRAETVQGYQLDFYVQMDDVDSQRCTPVQFRELKALEVACSSRLHIKFGEGSLGKLEQFKLYFCTESSLQVSGLKHLNSLKKVWLNGSCSNELKEAVQLQLAEHPKKPVFMPN